MSELYKAFENIGQDNPYTGALLSTAVGLTSLALGIVLVGGYIEDNAKVSAAEEQVAAALPPLSASLDAVKREAERDNPETFAHALSSMRSDARDAQQEMDSAEYIRENKISWKHLKEYTGP